MPDRDDGQKSLDRELARLTGATAELKPDDRFTDAVLRVVVASDPLARVARATDDLAPDDRFTNAILRAVKASPPPARPAFTEGIVRSGRAAIALAALAAAASVFLFLQTQRQVDAAIMSSIDTVEDSE